MGSQSDSRNIQNTPGVPLREERYDTPERLLNQSSGSVAISHPLYEIGPIGGDS